MQNNGFERGPYGEITQVHLTFSPREVTLLRIGTGRLLVKDAESNEDALVIGELHRELARTDDNVRGAVWGDTARGV